MDRPRPNHQLQLAVEILRNRQERNRTIAKGEFVAGPSLEIGNTISRYKYSIGAKRFIEEWNRQGPAHHCAVGVGHVLRKLSKLATLLSIAFSQVV